MEKYIRVKLYIYIYICATPVKDIRWSRCDYNENKKLQIVNVLLLQSLRYLLTSCPFIYGITYAVHTDCN